MLYYAILYKSYVELSPYNLMGSNEKVRHRLSHKSNETIPKTVSPTPPNTRVESFNKVDKNIHQSIDCDSGRSDVVTSSSVKRPH